MEVTSSSASGTFSSVNPIPPLQLSPSPFRPHVRAEERLYLWYGSNTPPLAVLDIPVLRHIDALATRASLCPTTTSSYGAALRKFHIFCDIFSVPEQSRLPASFSILKSFVLWASTDPEHHNSFFLGGHIFEPVAVDTARKYLSAVGTWHIAQGWPSPLTDSDHKCIEFTLRGLARIQGGSRHKPPRPPVTLWMLAALHAVLDLTDPFDAAIWAAASCALWGMMRFGEVTVASRRAFTGALHLKWSDALMGRDLDNKPYAKLCLPAAKTAKPGEIQEVFLAQQGDLCPILALQNLAKVVPAGPADPLFSWRDSHGDIRPLVRDAALHRINSIFIALGYGTSFGHSFRIGGASYYLAQNVSPEIVRIAGRWKSLAYEAYIRAFEQVVSRHMGNIASRAAHSVG